MSPKGKVYESQYAITPNLVFSEKNAGDAIGGIVSPIPGIGQYAGALGAVKFAEAQVTLFVTDNETTEQLIAAESSARATDIGLGGIVFGKLGGAGGLGWGNTNEGKVVAAAMLDAVNKTTLQAQKLAAKDLPAAAAKAKQYLLRGPLYLVEDLGDDRTDLFIGNGRENPLNEARGGAVLSPAGTATILQVDEFRLDIEIRVAREYTTNEAGAGSYMPVCVDHHDHAGTRRAAARHLPFLIVESVSLLRCHGRHALSPLGAV